jgi:hypothetical protein
MTHHSFVPVRVVCVVAVAGWLASAGIAGQSRTAKAPPRTSPAAKPWTPPLTPDGHPDLQGVWLNNSATPFERPKALEGKPSLSDEEVAELRRRAERLFSDGNADLPVGDNLFLAALANPEKFASPGGPNRSAAWMVPREFDNRTSLIVDPPDGRLPAVTPAAREKRAAAVSRDRAATGPDAFNNVVRCITSGVPRIGPGGSGDPLYGYYQIVQSPGYVVLLMETFHEARIIPLDGRPHVPAAIAQWNGDSRGRWEGHSLVVDTTNFSPKSDFLGSAEHLHIVERFTRVAPDTINYEVTVADPTTWVTPWTALIRLKQMPTKIYEYACHEGNHGIVGILEVARAGEKSADDAARRQK